MREGEQGKWTLTHVSTHNPREKEGPLAEAEDSEEGARVAFAKLVAAAERQRPSQ